MKNATKNLAAISAVFLFTAGSANALELEFAFKAPDQALSFDVSSVDTDGAIEKSTDRTKIENAARKLAGLKTGRSDSYQDKYSKLDPLFLDRFLPSKASIYQK